MKVKLEIHADGNSHARLLRKVIGSEEGVSYHGESGLMVVEKDCAYAEVLRLLDIAECHAVYSVSVEKHENN